MSVPLILTILAGAATFIGAILGVLGQKPSNRVLAFSLGFASIQAHGLTIDPLARSVLLHGQVVDLTPREFELLYFFARHPGEVFSRLALLEQVWGYQHEGYEHTVNTHINRLRIKIEKDAAEPEIIRTVWGKGYKFAEPQHDASL